MILMLLVLSALLPCGALLLNLFIIRIPEVNAIALFCFLIPAFFILMGIIYLFIRYHTPKRYIKNNRIMNSIENNLISIGAYMPKTDAPYVVLPQIRIKNDVIYISLKNLKIRRQIEQFKSTFSTALPGEYIVDDIELSSNSNVLKIVYDDLSKYKQETYSVKEYKLLIDTFSPMDFYFDKKHIVNLNSYPMWSIIGGTGSGKTIMAQQLLLQAVIKGFETHVFDCKHTYGMFRNYTDYLTDSSEILLGLSDLEKEMNQRYADLEPLWDINPRATAFDLGYKPVFILVEEYAVLQDDLDNKRDVEELRRIIRILSKKARQCSMHLFLVSQTGGVDTIDSSTRNNLNKVLLGNAMNNILISTFQSDKEEIPTGTFNAGEGRIQLERITILRTPFVNNIEEFASLFEQPSS